MFTLRDLLGQQESATVKRYLNNGSKRQEHMRPEREGPMCVEKHCDGGASGLQEYVSHPLCIPHNPSSHVELMGVT